MPYFIIFEFFQHKMEVDTPQLQQPGTASPSKASGNGLLIVSAGAHGSVTVAIHPLVVMNLSEHWTRVKAQNNHQPADIFGALLGKQEGRHLEVMNSFEMLVEKIDGQCFLIDREFFNTREAQYKEVFADLEVLGWYTTGDKPSEADVGFHRQMCEINEIPLMIKLNPLSKHHEKLPIFIYESVMDIFEGEAKMMFLELPYTLATEEAERIGVDHVARLSRAQAGMGEKSVVSEHLLAQQGAIKMLLSRVRVVLEYTKSIQNGLLPRNEEILRQVKSICSRLPIVSSNERFADEFRNQCGDVTLICYLGMLTKSCNTLNQVKIAVKYLKKGQDFRLRLSIKKT